MRDNDDIQVEPNLHDIGPTTQVPVPEIGDGSGVGKDARNAETVRALAVPQAAASVRATVRTVASDAPIALGAIALPRGLRQAVLAAAAPADLEALEEIDFGTVEEDTDPDAGAPLFVEYEPSAVEELLELSPEPLTLEPLTPAAPPLPPLEPEPVLAPPLLQLEPEPAPTSKVRKRRGKSQRRIKKRDRSDEKARARATTRAAGSGPLAEELPTDAFVPGSFFGNAPPLPDMGTFDLQMPTRRNRSRSRQDMQAMLQEFSVMFRMDTKVRRRRSGWVVAVGVCAVGAAVAFLATRTAPVDAADDQSIRDALVHANVVHAGRTLYLLDMKGASNSPFGALTAPAPSAATLGVAAPSVATLDVAEQAVQPPARNTEKVAEKFAPKRLYVSLLSLKLGQLVRLRALKIGADARRLRGGGR